MKKYCRGKKYQQGATMWTTLTVALMAGFMVYLGFVIGNVYLDHSIVRGSIKELVATPNFKNMSKMEAFSSLQKRLLIDGVRDIDRSAFEIKKDKSGARYVHIKYSVTSHVMANVSALVEFDEEIRPED